MQESQPSIEYIPQVPKPPAQQPEYSLVRDVTGDDPVKRGPQTLIGFALNEKKEPVKVQFKVPFAPKKNCKKCHGRGYVGFMVTTNNIIPCRKCYPML